MWTQNGFLAQLVEHPVHFREVLGSSPRGPTITAQVKIYVNIERMTQMKKVLIIALALILVLVAFAGCKRTEPTDTPPATTAPSTQAPDTKATAAPTDTSISQTFPQSGLRMSSN